MVWYSGTPITDPWNNVISLIITGADPGGTQSTFPPLQKVVTSLHLVFHLLWQYSLKRLTSDSLFWQVIKAGMGNRNGMKRNETKTGKGSIRAAVLWRPCTNLVIHCACSVPKQTRQHHVAVQVVQAVRIFRRLWSWMIFVSSEKEES